jgi:Spy/CpxP family protein refolding chaperone
MMNGKSWMIGAICAALLPIAASAQVGDNTPDGTPAHFRGAFRGPDATLLSGVTLTEAQQTQVQQLRQAEHAQIKPIMQQLRAVEGQLHTTLLAPGTVNSAALTALQGQVSALRTQLDQARLNTTIQIRNVLTPAQLATAASTVSQLKSLREQARSLMHPGQDGTAAQ